MAAHQRRHLRLVPSTPQAPLSIVVAETSRLHPVPGIPEPVADLQPALRRRVPVQPRHLGAVQATQLDAEPGPRFAGAADPGGSPDLGGERPRVGEKPVASLVEGLRGALTCVDWLKCACWAYCVAFWVIVGLVLARYA